MPLRVAACPGWVRRNRDRAPIEKCQKCFHHCLNLIVGQSGIHSAQMVDQSATCFDGRAQKAHLPSGAACCHTGSKIRSVYKQFEVDD
jgi:hypothetical protein